MPLPPDLVALLSTLRRSQRSVRLDGDEPVFQRDGGKPWTVDAVRYHFRRAVEACTELPDHKAAAVRFHDMRHTYASIAVQNGVPLQTVSRILGHQTIEMTMRYAHWCPDDRRRAAAVVGNALRLASQRRRAAV